ncbi:hypothetical protein GCM10011609_86290 [Lentzea pudingi]|uniref:Uncharacterized protein n=1 Tax=Lentzea pudingi TaxID=1789439 RepID=A0ABQ2IU70_9PSEU|nr:hypothetical protein GCM10011609_86290 [Lentzea pudingi]
MGTGLTSSVMSAAWWRSHRLAYPPPSSGLGTGCSDPSLRLWTVALKRRLAAELVPVLELALAGNSCKVKFRVVNTPYSQIYETVAQRALAKGTLIIAGRATRPPARPASPRLATRSGAPASSRWRRST